MEKQEILIIQQSSKLHFYFIFPKISIYESITVWLVALIRNSPGTRKIPGAV